MNAGRFVGAIFTALGGGAAVVASLVVTHNANSLYGLLAVALMLGAMTRDVHPNQVVEFVAGVVMFLLSLAVVVAIVVTGNPNCLYALLGVAIAGVVVNNNF